VLAFCDNSSEALAGSLRPDPSRPGIGVDLKEADAARFAV